MPESNVALYRPDARNNFDAVRPAPICTDANQAMGQCHNIHISRNCYYGYHNPKTLENVYENTDCEMSEPQLENQTGSTQTATRKRSADSSDYPKSKRLREDIETATKPRLRLPAANVIPECDEVRLYFRGYGVNNNQLQSMFTTSDPQQSRYISMSHDMQREKSIEPETNETSKLNTSSEDLLETLYWNIHGGNIYHLIQCVSVDSICENA